MAAHGAPHPTFIWLDQRTRRLTRALSASAAGVFVLFETMRGSTPASRRPSATHVTKRGMRKIKSPMDGMGLQAGKVKDT